MAAETWLVHIAAVVFIFVAGYVLIQVIFPYLETIFTSVIKDKSSISALFGLLSVIVLIYVFGYVITSLMAIENNVMAYFKVLDPAISLLKEFIPIIKYLLLGWLVIVAFKKH